MAGRADERPRDHPADAEPFSDNLVCDLARAIELRDWNDVFMRRDLEHAVSRPVAYERPDHRRTTAPIVSASADRAQRSARQGDPRSAPSLYSASGNASQVAGGRHTC